MKTFISNAFSFNMISEELTKTPFDILVTPATPEQAALDILAAEYQNNLVISIGNKATVNLLNTMCGTNIERAKADIVLNTGDSMIVFQYNGPRLSDDMVTIPDGGTAHMYTIEVVPA